MARFEKGRPRAPTAGRRPGTPNKVASDIRAICQKAAPEVLTELLRLSRFGKHEMTRIAAAKEILDRGFGRAKQTLTGEVLVGVSAELAALLDRHDGTTKSIPLRADDATEVEALPAPNGHAFDK